MRSISSDDAASGFSTSTCLPASQRGDRKVGMGGGRRRDDHGFDRVVVEHVVEVDGAPDVRVAALRQLERRLAAVAAPHQLGVRMLAGDTGEVRAPVAEADEGDADGVAHGTAARVQCVDGRAYRVGDAVGVLERQVRADRQ